MSPMYLEDRFNVDRVAIIGAGPCGLAAAKYLLAEKKFSLVQIFEQRDTVGGVWAYSSLNVVDSDFGIPRTKPTRNPDTAIAVEGHEARQFVSPVYDFLETNIPHTLMNYSDQKFPPTASLFPPHQVVKRYLEDYAEDLKDAIKLSTQVLSLKKVQIGSQACWEIETRDLKTDESAKAHFDAVMVASGHYNDPFIPDIPGLADFDKAHPGIISHSKFYRNPSQYENKKVVIVGNSASGIDLSAQISAVSKLPIIVSEKTTPKTPAEEDRSTWAKTVPEIVEFVPEGRKIRLANGETESGIDGVVFCTGYFYSFPFLRDLSPPVVTDGAYARNLYQHLLYIDDPTLAFAGVPQRIVPFPVSEGQAAYVARAWADRLALPARAEMRAWEARVLGEQGEGKLLHNLAFPKDIEYINTLHARSLEAERRPGLANDGVGKVPPFWDDEKRWTRERFPLIKTASRKLGDKRHEVTTLEELGFDYKAWKAGVGEEERLL
ncbi:Thiol-specific monooxygenase [Colletotrichum spinosum]|uniref:Thiol-specific monooxygenase n=1 Tax=Colletotrichum spinosum TaxID=1347390 RepID=A0A4R8QKF0_9PEZI|nr:Thiol-specific monooxygenase [Colletotrichum spinosum]